MTSPVVTFIMAIIGGLLVLSLFSLELKMCERRINRLYPEASSTTYRRHPDINAQRREEMRHESLPAVARYVAALLAWALFLWATRSWSRFGESQMNDFTVVIAAAVAIIATVFIGVYTWAAYKRLQQTPLPTA